ncbi:MAG TPA: putative toxin-antitoxin system toxin component, PIN family [Burkholderiaceae bacterium]|nr:putative toxin-antitoxin system toxin component, PIN family [Burkholderiaceae bacterium]
MSALFHAVFDTNVLLDFWVFANRGAAPLRTALEAGTVGAWRSGPVIDELSDVLARPGFGLSPERRCDILRHWGRLTRPVTRVFPAPWACSDSRDQMFVDLAFSARADWLITRDKALLKLARRARAAGLAIVEPIAAIARMTTPQAAHG